jgi:hypothetical protein
MALKANKLPIVASAVLGLLTGTAIGMPAYSFGQDPASQTPQEPSKGKGQSSDKKEVLPQTLPKDQKKPETVREKHACKGQNSCRQRGGCKSSDNGCKGKNSCKGKGGCAADAMPQEKPAKPA